MAEFDFSRRDLLGQGALLAGAALTAGMLSSCTTGASGKGMALSTAPDAKPITPLGEDAQVRVGFIGVGGRGTGLLNDTFTYPGVTVKAVCDLKPPRLQAAVKAVEEKQGHKPTAYGDDPKAYLKILMRDDIDAVVIATPCDLHAPMILDSIKHGKHVYSEKPAAITKASADQLVAEVPKSGLVVAIGFQRRASKRYPQCIQLLRDGAVGAIIQMTAAWDNGGGPLRGWLGDRSRSGDWMLEQACHTWDVLNWVAGTLPVAAYGWGRRDIYIDPVEEPNRDVTDYYVATLAYPEFVVRYSHSWGAPANEMFSGVYERIYGTKAAMDMETGQLFKFREPGAPVERIAPDEPNHWMASIHRFYDCVRQGEQHPSTVTNGRDASLVGLLVRKAVDERRVVTMNEILKAE